MIRAAPALFAVIVIAEMKPKKAQMLQSTIEIGFYC